MITNVSTLLRDFTRVRRAVLSGDEVVVKTREGNLRIIADKPAGSSVLGRCKAMKMQTDDTIDQPTAPVEEWDRPG
jgi:hypothetical protein